MATDQSSPLAAIDGAFGDGTVARLTAAAQADVRSHLQAPDPLGAAFSAAHFVVMTGHRGWSDDEHSAIVRAAREGAEVERAAHNLVTAAWWLAYVALLGEEVGSSASEAIATLAGEIADRLDNAVTDVRTAGMAVDMHVLSRQWLPTAQQTGELREAVRADAAKRLADESDRIMAADRAVLWFLIGVASGLEAGDARDT